MGKIFTLEEAQEVGNQIGVNWVKYNLEQFRIGLGVEHGIINPAANVNNDDLIAAGKIALAHLNEFPGYYDRPGRMKGQQNEPHKRIHRRYAVDASIDSIVDPPLTETYQSSYKENRREDNKLMLDV